MENRGEECRLVLNGGEKVLNLAFVGVYADQSACNDGYVPVLPRTRGKVGR